MDKTIVHHVTFKYVNDVWRIVDAENVSDRSKPIEFNPDMTFADWMSGLGIDIPEFCTYCLLDTPLYKIKFRLTGYTINVYINFK